MNNVSKFIDRLRNQELVEKFNKMEHFPATTTIDNARKVTGQPFKATFDIVITRLTNDIAADLHVGILGFSQILSGYRGIVLPATGGTVVVTGGIYNTLPNQYNFTHTVGADVDIITVTCPEIPYPSFIQSSGLDRYRINNVRYSISDGAVQDQFSNRFTIQDSGIFGKKSENTLTPITFKDPMNEQDNIIDIPIGQDMDKEHCIVIGVSNTVAPFEVTLSFFVEYYDKFTASGM